MENALMCGWSIGVKSASTPGISQFMKGQNPARFLQSYLKRFWKMIMIPPWPMAGILIFWKEIMLNYPQNEYWTFHSRRLTRELQWISPRLFYACFLRVHMWGMGIFQQCSRHTADGILDIWGANDLLEYQNRITKVKKLHCTICIFKTMVYFSKAFRKNDPLIVLNAAYNVQR